MRFAGMVIAAGFLIQGSYELGFPTYSVLAGLGVGGLAVALAARDSLANLLGSMLIMIEKPFRVGHYVRVSGGEGTVEDVGFRSTRIRTPDNSLISIPNNSVVYATVENLSLRMMRRHIGRAGLRLHLPSPSRPARLLCFAVASRTFLMTSSCWCQCNSPTSYTWSHVLSWRNTSADIRGCRSRHSTKTS
jgi:MscS family membrane protein